MNIRTAARILGRTVILAALLSVVGCAGPTTRRDLQARMGMSFPYTGSHFLYMGSKDGCDYLAHTWEDFQGSPGLQMFRLRSGELRVGPQTPFTADHTRWREIDIFRR